MSEKNAIYQISPAPEWVKKTELSEVKLDKADQDSPFYYPLVQYQENISDQSQESYHRTYQVIQDASRIENASLILNELHEGSQRLIIHELVIYRNGEKIDALDPENISAIQRERSLESHITDNKITVSISIDDLRVGDHVDFSSTLIETANTHPFLGKHFSSNYFLTWNCPVISQQLRVNNNSSTPLTILHGNHKLGVDSYTRETLNPADTFDQTNESLSSSTVPNSAPNWVWDSFIQVTTQTTWPQLSDYLYHYYADNNAFSDEEIDLNNIDQLDLDKYGQDIESQAIGIIRFVQNNIRYKGENQGIFTHTPKKPNRTLKKRAGDCKDKSNLLMTLLRQINIDASLVLVHSTHGVKVNTHNPSPYHFNHMIVQINHLGKLYYFDPTIQKQSGDFAHSAELNYGYGLVLKEGGSELVMIKRDVTKQVFNLEHLFLFNTKQAVMKVKRTFTLHRADNMRAYFSSTENSKLHDDFLNWAKSDTSLELSNKNTIRIVSDDPISNTIITEEAYNINNLNTTHKGKRIELLTDFYRDFIVSDNHRYPVRIDLDGKVSQTINVYYKTKPGVDISDKRIKTDAFEYEDSVKIVGQKQLVFKISLTPFKQSVPVKDVKEHCEHVEQMRQRSLNIFPHKGKKLIAASEINEATVVCLVLLAYFIYKLLT